MSTANTYAITITRLIGFVERLYYLRKKRFFHANYNGCMKRKFGKIAFFEDISTYPITREIVIA